MSNLTGETCHIILFNCNLNKTLFNSCFSGANTWDESQFSNTGIAIQLQKIYSSYNYRFPLTFPLFLPALTNNMIPCVCMCVFMQEFGEFDLQNNHRTVPSDYQLAFLLEMQTPSQHYTVNYLDSNAEVCWL